MLRHAPHVALLTPLLHAAASLPCSHVACASRHARQPLCQWTCSRTQLALMSSPKPDLNWLPITRNHGCRWTLCYWTPPTAPRAGPSRPSRRRSAPWLSSWQPRRRQSQVSDWARSMLSTVLRDEVQAVAEFMAGERCAEPGGLMSRFCLYRAGGIKSAWAPKSWQGMAWHGVVAHNSMACTALRYGIARHHGISAATCLPTTLNEERPCLPSTQPRCFVWALITSARNGRTLGLRPLWAGACTAPQPSTRWAASWLG